MFALVKTKQYWKETVVLVEDNDGVGCDIRSECRLLSQRRDVSICDVMNAAGLDIGHECNRWIPAHESNMHACMRVWLQIA